MGAQKFHIVAYNPEAHPENTNDGDQRKCRHIRQIAEHYRERGVREQDIMLVDDSYYRDSEPQRAAVSRPGDVHHGNVVKVDKDLVDGRYGMRLEHIEAWLAGGATTQTPKEELRLDPDLGNVTLEQLSADFVRQTDAAGRPPLDKAELLKLWNALPLAKT